MFDCDDIPFSAAEFSGQARLFPLPNLVMFPHVIQPLHIFEPRYRDMIRDALNSDRLLAMALLAPGWEHEYEGRPPIYPMACLGRILSCRKLGDGRYNLVLQGLCRAQIVREEPIAHSYRTARLELQADQYAQHTTESRSGLRRKLIRKFRSLMPPNPEAQNQLDELLNADLSLGMLTDIVAYTVDLDLTTKQTLLSETDVDRRAAQLVEYLTRCREARKPSSCQLDSQDEAACSEALPAPPPAKAGASPKVGTPSGAEPFPPRFSCN